MSTNYQPKYPDWSGANVPGANKQATFTQPTPGPGYRLIVTGFTVGFAAGNAAPSAVNTTVSLYSGNTGALADHYMWQFTISLPSIAGSENGVSREDLWISGLPNTPITLEFSAAGGANTFESVSMEGMIVPV